MAISQWPILAMGQTNLPRLLRIAKVIRALASAALLFAAPLAALLISLEILRSPWPALLAFAVGIFVRCLGQQWNRQQVRRSPKAAELAGFSFDGRVILCHFEDSAIRAFTSTWSWRIAAAIAAGLACLAAQYLHSLGFNALPASPRIPHWVYWLLDGCLPGLPLYVAALFLRIKGPERRWMNQLKAAIETRAAASLAEMLARQELDGLEGGIDVLWQKLGVDRSGDYRAAFSKRIGTHTTEAVLQPAATSAMLQALTELARLDLRSISTAVDSFQQIQREAGIVRALAAASRNPLHEMKAEELERELEHLTSLAANRQWDDLQARIGKLQTEFDDLRSRLGRHSASVPTVALPSGSDPYRVLGVTADTPTLSIRKLRTRLAQLYHPDVSGSTGNSLKMSELNAAYDAVMRDREKEGR
jgi:DnaJ domain